LAKFILAYELGITPSEADKLPAIEVEAYLKLISEMNKKKAINERKLRKEW